MRVMRKAGARFWWGKRLKQRVGRGAKTRSCGDAGVVRADAAVVAGTDGAAPPGLHNVFCRELGTPRTSAESAHSSDRITKMDHRLILKLAYCLMSL